MSAAVIHTNAGPVSVDYDVLAMGAEPSGSMPGMKMPGH